MSLLFYSFLLSQMELLVSDLDYNWRVVISATVMLTMMELLRSTAPYLDWLQTPPTVSLFVSMWCTQFVAKLVTCMGTIQNS